MTFTVQVEYGSGAYADAEATQGFNDMDDKSFDLINSCTKGCD